MIPTEARSWTPGPSSAPPTKQPDAVDVGWRLTDAIALVGVLYGIGLLAANIYLMQFGAADFSLLRPRAVVTGALIVLPAVIALWLPLFMFNRPSAPSQAGSWLGALNRRFTTGQAWVGEVSFGSRPSACRCPIWTRAGRSSCWPSIGGLATLLIGCAHPLASRREQFGRRPSGRAAPQ